MAHWSENSHPLAIRCVSVREAVELQRVAQGFDDVCILLLPPCVTGSEYQKPIQGIGEQVARVSIRESAFPYAAATQMGFLSLSSESAGSIEQFALRMHDKLPEPLTNRILEGDCLENLATVPDNSIDFVFTDPPYNLGKGYSGYGDDLEIRQYFDIL